MLKIHNISTKNATHPQLLLCLYRSQDAGTEIHNTAHVSFSFQPSSLSAPEENTKVKDEWRPRRISLFYRRAHLCMKKEKQDFEEGASSFRQSATQLMWMAQSVWLSSQQVDPVLLPLAFKLFLQDQSTQLNIAIAQIWWAVSPVFTSNYRSLKPQKNFICQCTSVLKNKKESSTTNSHARQMVILSVHF